MSVTCPLTTEEEKGYNISLLKLYMGLIDCLVECIYDCTAYFVNIVKIKGIKGCIVWIIICGSLQA